MEDWTTDNWDTEETSRIIANEERLYLEAFKIARRSHAAENMETAFADIMKDYPHSKIDVSAIDWETIAAEY